MKLPANGACDVCGNRRGRPFDHTQCAKIRQARGGVKETVRPARPDKDTVEYLAKTEHADRSHK